MGNCQTQVNGTSRAFQQKKKKNGTSRATDLITLFMKEVCRLVVLLTILLILRNEFRATVNCVIPLVSSTTSEL